MCKDVGYEVEAQKLQEFMGMDVVHKQNVEIMKVRSNLRLVKVRIAVEDCRFEKVIAVDARGWILDEAAFEHVSYF